MANEKGKATLTLVPSSSEYAVRVEMPVDRPTPQQAAVRQYMGALNNRTLSAVKAKRDTSKEESTRATLKDYFQTLSIAALSQREAALKHEVMTRTPCANLLRPSPLTALHRKRARVLTTPPVLVALEQVASTVAKSQLHAEKWAHALAVATARAEAAEAHAHTTQEAATAATNAQHQAEEIRQNRDEMLLSIARNGADAMQVRADAERARGDAERARADAERARASAERARGDRAEVDCAAAQAHAREADLKRELIETKYLDTKRRTRYTH